MASKSYGRHVKLLLVDGRADALGVLLRAGELANSLHSQVLEAVYKPSRRSEARCGMLATFGYAHVLRDLMQPKADVATLRTPEGRSCSAANAPKVRSSAGRVHAHRSSSWRLTYGQPIKCSRFCATLQTGVALEITLWSRGVHSLAIDELSGRIRCITCMLCVASCPSYALSIARHAYISDSIRAPTLYQHDGMRCIWCGSCTEVCPVACIQESEFLYTSQSTHQRCHIG